MNTNDLKKIVADALKVPVKKIDENTKFGDLEEWDSLGQLSIISLLDKKLNKKMSSSNLKPLFKADSIKKFILILKQNKVIK
jgi:acyl carrier protein